MTAVTIKTDTLIHITESASSRIVGSLSPYANEKVHPSTLRKIQGWRWNERTWPTYEEELSTEVVPSLWNADLDYLPDNAFQSGYGDGNDLLMIGTKVLLTDTSPNIWAPKINHGEYFLGRDQWYLYSDQRQTSYFERTKTLNGVYYSNLKYNPRPFIPLTVQQYNFNSSLYKYEIHRSYRQVLTFTNSEPEFTVDYAYEPPRLFINSGFNETIGTSITLTSSGTADSSKVLSLESLGLSNGSARQKFYSYYSPIDRSQSVSLWSYKDPGVPTSWTLVEGGAAVASGLLTSEIVSNSQWALIDYDLGTLEFGGGLLDTEFPAQIPKIGETLAISYTPTVEAIYEPEDISKDTVVAPEADLHPFRTAQNSGFVQITTSPVHTPYSVYLSCSNIEALTGSYTRNTYSIDVGNNVASMKALILARDGSAIEGIDVTFEILTSKLGSFGRNLLEITSATNQEGVASAFYLAPPSISKLGKIVSSPGDISFVASGANWLTTLNFRGEESFNDITRVCLYSLTRNNSLFMEAADIVSGYSSFFATEHITNSTATQDWEETYRTVNNLMSPQLRGETIETTGKKIVLGRTSAPNPITGVLDTSHFPLLPTSSTAIGTSTDSVLEIVYTTLLSSGHLEDYRTSSSIWGYMIVGDCTASLRARITLPNGYVLYSNIVDLLITIPDSMNGIFATTVLDDIPATLMKRPIAITEVSDATIITYSGVLDDDYQEEKYKNESYIDWFKRTQRGNSEVLGLSSVAITDAGYDIPLGFRLKSTGVTVASVLDAVTFYNTNAMIEPPYLDVVSGIYKMLT